MTSIVSETLVKSVIDDIFGVVSPPRIVVKEYGEVSVVFYFLGDRSLVRQQLSQLAASFEPASYTNLEKDDISSWSYLEKGVLCVETSARFPRSFPGRRIPEWKLLGGNEYVPVDIGYVSKLRVREASWRDNAKRELIKCEEEIQNNNMTSCESFEQAILCTAKYMSLKIDAVFNVDFFNGVLEHSCRDSQISANRCYLLDNSDVVSTPKRIRSEFVKHVHCWLDGSFSGQCVQEFMNNSAYLTIEDVDDVRLYDYGRARVSLEKFCWSMTSQKLFCEEQRINDAEVSRKKRYSSLRFAVACENDSLANSVLDLASLSVLYDESLRDIRTRFLRIARENMLGLGCDLRTTSLDEICKRLD